MKSVKSCLLGLCLIGTTYTANAEIRYVTDELRLSLFELINSKGKLLKRLNSGDELELLEEEGFFAKVRTQDGIEGWTKAGFLIREKPARAQLVELQQQHDRLNSQLKQSQAQLSNTRSELDNLRIQQEEANAAMQDQIANAEGVVAALDRIQQENEALRSNKYLINTTIPLNWGLIASGVTFVMGLIAGIALFDYRSRKRHGGYRIH
jgi:SH3 domain protein